jgi:hypothetical protein
MDPGTGKKETATAAPSTPNDVTKYKTTQTKLKLQVDNQSN